MTVPLRLAVCLFPGVKALDYQGPMEVLGYLSLKKLNDTMRGQFPKPPPYSLDTSYLSHNLEPVEPISGPLVLPNALYNTTDQYDVILVPGGL
jgi:putative intracellular protease/amidase